MNTERKVTLPDRRRVRGVRVHACCAAKVANARGGGGGGLAGGGGGDEEADEEGRRPAAWWMPSGYERSREASVMVEALAQVVAGGGAPAGARREGVSPAGAWQGYGYGEMSPSHSAPPHGNPSSYMPTSPVHPAFPDV